MISSCPSRTNSRSTSEEPLSSRWPAPEEVAIPFVELSSWTSWPGETVESELPASVSASPTLYDIFREEARGHLQTLVESYGVLEADPRGRPLLP
jgi:chemosensory pili system protein ChpA (sensor histidine kinase/response regulator)